MNTLVHDSPTSHQKNQFGKLWALFVLIFIDSLNYFLVIPVFKRLFFSPYHLTSATLSAGTRDLLFAFAVLLSPLAFILFSPLAGYFSDRFGRKKTLITCLCFSLVGYLIPIIGIHRNLLSLVLLGRFLAGAATSSQPIAQAAVADITRGKQKAIYFALIGFAMTLAMILGPSAGALLSDTNLIAWFTPTLPYYIGVALSALNLFLLLLFFTETHQTQLNNIHQPRLIKLIKKPSLLHLFLIFFLLEFAWSQYYQVLFLQMPSQYHYSVNQVALFTSYIGLWMSLGLTYIYRAFISRLRIETFTRLSLILALLGLLTLSLFPALSVQWVAVIFAATFTGAAYANLLTLLSNETDPAYQGTVLGFTSTLLGITWAITAFTGAVLLKFSLQLPFYLACFCIIIAVLLTFKRRAQ